MPIVCSTSRHYAQRTNMTAQCAQQQPAFGQCFRCAKLLVRRNKTFAIDHDEGTARASLGRTLRGRRTKASSSSQPASTTLSSSSREVQLRKKSTAPSWSTAARTSTRPRGTCASTATSRIARTLTKKTTGTLEPGQHEHARLQQAQRWLVIVPGNMTTATKTRTTGRSSTDDQTHGKHTA